MKQTVQLREIQKSMAAGQLSLEGFLGDDKRNLIDILCEDDATVKRFGISHEEIANRMERFYRAGEKGLGETILVDAHFEVKVDDVRGKMASPFHDQVFLQKTNIVVNNLFLKKSIVFTVMNIHLIKNHGFYEGKGARFRLNPEELIEVLEIKKALAESNG